ncbi:hypothetical protein F4604DRAFT_224207 [Suillus subluteus]|nr:hypothetical protein F4604DRAFT_224207 [Suillus subluteus]
MLSRMLTRSFGNWRALIYFCSACAQADSLLRFKPITGSFTNSSVTKRFPSLWKRNRDIFDEWEVRVAGYACITAIRGNYPVRYEQSRTTIRNLVKKWTAGGQKEAWKGGDSTFVSIMRKLKGLLVGKDKPCMKKNVACRLTKRCGLAPDVAKELADRIEDDVVKAGT